MTREEKTQRQRVKMRRVPGRRAKVVNGVFVPVKEEVPQAAANFCTTCTGYTLRTPDAAGVVRCSTCDPSERSLPKNKVWRLCIRCDRRIQRSPRRKGPFFCLPCGQEVGTILPRIHPPGRCNPREDVIRTERADEVRVLTDLYGAVLRHPSESAARAAGLPTKLHEFVPLLPKWRANVRDENDAGRVEEEEGL